jgi:hypothetical protein
VDDVPRGTMDEVRSYVRLDLPSDHRQDRPKDWSTSFSNPIMEGPWCRFRREARACERPRHRPVDSLKALDPTPPIREADIWHLRWCSAKKQLRRAVMLASFRRYPFCFPKGQLTSGPVSRPTDCSSGYVVLQLGVCRVAYRYVWTEKQSRRPHSSAANVALQLSSLPNDATRASTTK